jgi:hypothetical protein
MPQEFCIPITMKAMAPGHSLNEAECIAAMHLHQGVLLCALTGCTTVLPASGNGPEQLLRSAGMPRTCERRLRACVGILPAQPALQKRTPARSVRT